MRDVCSLIWLALSGLFRSRASLQAEILTLRHQLNVLRRKSPRRLIFTSIDRLVFAGLYRLAPGVLDVLKIVRTETVIRWHRAGFRACWCWKSRPRSGRPTTPLEIRQLLREKNRQSDEPDDRLEQPCRDRTNRKTVLALLPAAPSCAAPADASSTNGITDRESSQ